MEFRNLLTTLHLGYSDKRFNRLFKAVDTKASGKIGIADLENLLFPSKVVKKPRGKSESNMSVSPSPVGSKPSTPFARQEGLSHINSKV